MNKAHENVGPRFRYAAIASAALATLLAAGPVAAQRIESMDEQLEKMKIAEKPNAQIPLDLTFTDADDRKKVALREVFDASRPVILTLNYSNCPKLCDVQIKGLVDGMRRMEWNLGEEYRIVTVNRGGIEIAITAAIGKELEEYALPIG